MKYINMQDTAAVIAAGGDGTVNEVCVLVGMESLVVACFHGPTADSSVRTAAVPVPMGHGQLLSQRPVGLLPC